MFSTDDFNSLLVDTIGDLDKYISLRSQVCQVYSRNTYLKQVTRNIELTP